MSRVTSCQQISIFSGGVGVRYSKVVDVNQSKSIAVRSEVTNGAGGQTLNLTLQSDCGDDKWVDINAVVIHLADGIYLDFTEEAHNYLQRIRVMIEITVGTMDYVIGLMVKE